MWRNLIILFLICVALLGSFFWVYGKWLSRQERVERYKELESQKFEEISVTFVEGKTNQDYYKTLEAKGLGTSQFYQEEEFIFSREKYELLASLPKTSSLLGFLFPNTYRFAKIGGEKDVLPTLVNTFVKEFSKASQGVQQTAGKYLPEGYEKLRFPGEEAGLTVYELVTLASIVEKETGQAGESVVSQRLQTERQTVAGIFYNRLLIGQALESDATVNFVTGAGRAQPTYKDLEVDSKYNTYQNVGLPPGPIANVSFSSLYATLHPIKTDYYYFLHKQPSGEVVYSKTFEEHIQNKNRYLK